VSQGISDDQFHMTNGDAPLRVLVVEDDRDSLELYQMLLDPLGWSVRTAASAAAALEAIEIEIPDIVLSDLGLPDMSGVDLLPQLRERAGSRLPAIAISGFGFPESVERSRMAGFDAHLTKPILLADLRSAVEKLTMRCD